MQFIILKDVTKSHMKTTKILSAVVVALATFGFGLSSACAEQRAVNCTAAHGSFATLYTLTDGDPASTCGSMPGDVWAIQTYFDENQSRQLNYAEATVHILPEQLGYLADGREDLDGKMTASGDFTQGYASTADFCYIPDMEPARQNLAELPPLMDEETGELAVDEEGNVLDPGTPAANVEYAFSDLRFYVAPSAPGNQFAAEMTVTMDDCTASYHVVGLNPAVYCGSEEGLPDETLCSGTADPDNGRPLGSGINPDFKTYCDPVLLYCLIPQNPPSLRDDLPEQNVVPIFDTDALSRGALDTLGADTMNGLFTAVLHPRGRVPLYVLLGALAAVAGHLMAAAFAVFLSAQPTPPPPEPEPIVDVMLFDAPPPPPPPPGPARSTSKTKTKKPKVKPDQVVQPLEPEEPEPEEPEPPEEEEEPEEPEPEPDPPEDPPEAEEGGEPGGVKGGVKGGVQGGVVGGEIGGKKGGTLGGKGKRSVLRFGAGMTKPKRLKGNPPSYGRAARAAKVSGLVLVQCVITIRGDLHDCRIIKGHPLLNKGVLFALKTHKYRPVTLAGKPVSVRYNFKFRFKLPK